MSFTLGITQIFCTHLLLQRLLHVAHLFSVVVQYHGVQNILPLPPPPSVCPTEFRSGLCARGFFKRCPAGYPVKPSSPHPVLRDGISSRNISLRVQSFHGSRQSLPSIGPHSTNSNAPSIGRERPRHVPSSGMRNGHSAKWRVVCAPQRMDGELECAVCGVMDVGENWARPRQALLEVKIRDRGGGFRHFVVCLRCDAVPRGELRVLLSGPRAVQKIRVTQDRTLIPHT